MKRNTITIVMIMLGSSLLHNARYAQSTDVLTVSAAISLKNAFDEIGTLFESRQSGIIVQFNYGASGNLKMQIEGGAPVDVFASASAQEMDDLRAQNMLLNDSAVRFARNSVVLIQPEQSAIALKTFGDLTKDAIQKIALGNPHSVPAGRYAQEVLEHFRLFDALKHKFVVAENVRQVLDYVSRGEVDAGMVYLTDARTKAGKVTMVIEAWEGSHKPVIYQMAVIKGTQCESIAGEFVWFVNTDDAKTILRQHGFK